ncbi:MAG: glycosyltransferase [Candidatus Thiodiazotropha sp. 6PDIVS]
MNGIVGNSDHILQAHLTNGYFKHAKKYVVSGGLSESFIRDHKKPPNKVSHIGYLGQIVLTKGVDDFIQLAHKYNNLNFVIGGDVSNQYALKLKMKNKLSNLFWLGRVDPEEFLDSIDILIVPSKWHEPLPRVIYEAYARGILVVATDNGGNPSVMKKLSAEYRLLYSSDNSNSLFSIFQDALNLISSGKYDPNVLIKNSLNFTKTKIVDQYCRIYNEVKD